MINLHTTLSFPHSINIHSQKYFITALIHSSTHIPHLFPSYNKNPPTKIKSPHKSIQKKKPAGL